MYRWHRIASLIIAVPVFLWALSGFMHPLMTNVRPQVATQKLQARAVDTAKIRVSLQQALEKNKIEHFSQFRLVAMHDNWFYQVKLPDQLVLKYYSTENGKLLPQGDELYARYLARQFLEGDDLAAAAVKGNKLLAALKPEPLAGGSSTPAAEAINGEEQDCCTNTMAAILNTSKGAKVSSVAFKTQFDEEYKYVNRYLPAYKVSFAREDGVRIYVETAADRFAFAVDNKRAAFDTFFSWFHTLGWLDVLGRGKHLLEVVIMLLAIFTTVMGLYMFFTTKPKKAAGNTTARARRIHRYTAVTASLFTLLFTFSGGYHALSKLKPDTRDQYTSNYSFEASAGNPDLDRLLRLVDTGRALTNVSLVQIGGQSYWQLFSKSSKAGAQPAGGGRDLMKSMTVPPPSTVYVAAADYTVLKEGEQQYARALATRFSGRPADKIINTQVVTRFEGEYGFVNKRLPVWKVGYEANSRERWYVETSSGKLSTLVNDNDLAEGYSFALFHKHHFMDWGGKLTRDISTMCWAFMQMLMIGLGVWFWSKTRKKKAARMEQSV